MISSPMHDPACSPQTPSPSLTPPTPAEHTMPVRALRGGSVARVLPESSELSTARGKGGCWTCRLRRKKCDEQRDSGSCHTCIRLKIECLGWGVRRPNWMRDKAQVEAYKAAIKQQLSSQGMIRGQPKTPAPASQRFPYPRPRADTGSDGTDEYAYDPAGSTHTSPSYPPRQMPQLTPDLSSGISALDLQLYGPTAPITPPVLPSTFATPSPHVIDSDLATILPFVPSHAYYDATPAPAPTSSAPSPHTREHHVLYYFRRVRQIQFLFAGPSLISIFHDLVVRDPTGPVTNAMCALAALHKSQMRVAEGLEDPASETSLHAISKQYYDQAWWQVLDSRRRHHRYMEQDASAAIHLVSYWVFGGGGGDWEAPLAVASDWLADSPLNTMAHPRLQWLQLCPSARITVQMIMWLDIISAIDTRREPRFMGLYRRLFRTDQQPHSQNYWSGSPHGGHGPVHSLHMADLTGCPDGIMYALAETASLAHWKEQQQQNHSLSIHELVRRSDAIEQDLRAAWVTASPEVFPHLLEQHYDGMGASGPLSAGTASTSASAQPSPIHPTIDLGGAASVLSTPEPTIGAETRRLVANVFFEAAVLHLQSVVNDHNTAVPEIMDGVGATMQALHKLALCDVDRGLVFPICIAGCLADVREQRQFFRQRLDAVQQNVRFGNLAETRRLMEVVWRKRDAMRSGQVAAAQSASQAGGDVVDWRHTMPDIGVKLLII